MSPLYLAVLVRCLGVPFWRNAWSDYGYMFCVSRFHGAVLGLVVDMSVGCNDRALVRQWRKLVPQLQFFAGRHPDPHGPDYSTDHRDLLNSVVDVPGVRVAQILRCKRGGDSRLPQLQLLRIPSRFRACSWTRLLTCPCCSTTGAWSLGAENCGSPQLQCVSQWECGCDA